MENQKKILIDEQTKGVLVAAKHNLINSVWIILIHSVENYNTPNVINFRINSHMSFCIGAKAHFIYEVNPGWWGDSIGYTFYEPTEKQKQMVVNILKEHNLKFISVLNKLVCIK